MTGKINYLEFFFYLFYHSLYLVKVLFININERVVEYQKILFAGIHITEQT